MKKVLYALEGTVYAGKTSLLREVQGSGWGIETVEEYIEHAADGFPREPRNLAEALAGMEFFLGLERCRTAGVDEKSTVVLDRSVLSVLAFEFAIGQMARSVPYWEQALHVVTRQQWMWPDVCVYLRIDDFTLWERHMRAKGQCRPLFLDGNFNRHLRRFYEVEMVLQWPEMELLVLDGSKGADRLYEDLFAYAYVRQDVKR